MMTSPRWSVVIPTFRRPATLVECLARLAPGVQAIDASRYEVIVTDDAREAETRELVAARFPWARYVEGPARGPAANRNAGARAARGEWIAFIDDDTLPERDWLSAYDRASRAATAPDALEGRTTCAAGFGTPMHYAPVNERGDLFWSCNIAVRAARFAAIGGFDEGFGVAHMEDRDLHARLKDAGVRIPFVAEAVVDHPPRRQPPGRTLGALRAAEVRYLYKHGVPRSIRRRLTLRVIALRFGIIRSLPLSVDSLRALWSLAEELAVVQWNLPKWEREARREFPSGGAR